VCAPIQEKLNQGRASKFPVSFVLRQFTYDDATRFCLPSHVAGAEGGATTSLQMQRQVSNPKHIDHAREGDFATARHRMCPWFCDAAPELIRDRLRLVERRRQR
jgi:hypothetical protein